MPVLALAARGPLFALLECVAVYAAPVAASRPARRQMLPMIGCGALLAAVGLWAVFRHPYLVVRLFAWRHAPGDPRAMGCQAMQSLRALRSAGPRGQGPTAPLPTLPGVHADFVFPYLVYTPGWVAGALICLLALYFVLRLAQVARRVHEPFGSMLVRGVLVLFAVQFGSNLLMTAGLVPVAGAELPFVSNGVQGALSLAAVGLVLGAFRRKDLGWARSDQGT